MEQPRKQKSGKALLLGTDSDPIDLESRSYQRSTVHARAANTVDIMHGSAVAHCTPEELQPRESREQPGRAALSSSGEEVVISQRE